MCRFCFKSTTIYQPILELGFISHTVRKSSFILTCPPGGRTLDVVTRENMKVNTLADNSKMVALKFLYKMHARQNLTDRLLPITLPFFFFDFQSTSALNAACTGSL